MTPRSAFCVLPLLLLSACATLDAESCPAVDWQARAFDAGASGAALDSVLGDTQTCAQFTAVPDAAELVTYWEEGADRFCTPARVFDAALRDGTSARVCGSPELSELAAIGAGHREVEARYRDARRTLDRLEGDIRRRRRSIDKRSAQIVELRRELADPAVPDAAKPEIRNAIAKFERKIAGNRRGIREARRNIPRARNALRRARAELRDSQGFVDGTLAAIARESRR